MSIAIVSKVVLWSAAASLFALGGSQEPGVFRSRTIAVSVDVAVRQGNTPVRGLSAADFVLTDQGVPQEVRVTEFGNLPLDLTLLLDVSGSTSDDHRRYETEATKVARLLRPGDRLRFIAFGTSVWEPVPMYDVSDVPVVREFTAGGATSLWDGLGAALMEPAAADRRSIALAFTDGDDTFSVLKVEDVAEIAGRSDTVVYVWLTPPSTRRMILSSVHGPLVVRDLGGGSPATRAPAWVPPIPNARDRLIELAETTGGGRLGSGTFGGSVARAVERLLEDFRSRYVLKYQPTGVSQSGWHEIKVRTSRSGDYRISSRKGYYAGS